MGDKLAELGYDRHGTERMYNGMTGEWFDVEIFITPCYYQRLQKFAVDEVYSISTGPTCAITHQPLTTFRGLKVHAKTCASEFYDINNYRQVVKFATFSNCGNTLRA
jgi:hypothetical protein